MNLLLWKNSQKPEDLNLLCHARLSLLQRGTAWKKKKSTTSRKVFNHFWYCFCLLQCKLKFSTQFPLSASTLLHFIAANRKPVSWFQTWPRWQQWPRREQRECSPSDSNGNRIELGTSDKIIHLLVIIQRQRLNCSALSYQALRVVRCSITSASPFLPFHNSNWGVLFFSECNSDFKGAESSPVLLCFNAWILYSSL